MDVWDASVSCFEQNGSVLVSTDGGATWVPQTTIPSPGNWTAVAASSDASTLVAVDSGGYIYINKNGTWAPATSAGVQPWSTVSVSADGSTIIAGTAGACWTWLVADGVRWHMHGGGN